MNNNVFMVAICCLLMLPACFTPKQKNVESKRNKRRIHRKEWRKQAWNKTFKDRSFEDLATHKDALIAAKDFYTAAKYLEKMISLCPDMEQLALLMLELADVNLEQGNLTVAEKWYKEFLQLFPGHERIEYASYKTTLCCFYQTLNFDRDQTKTEETLRLVDQFLKRKEVFTTYATEIQNIQHQCNQKRLRNEIDIVQGYINRGQLSAAEHRLQSIRNNYGPLFDATYLEPEILHIEIALAQKKNAPEQVHQKQAELHERFPDHPITLAYYKKRSLIDRF